MKLVEELDALSKHGVLKNRIPEYVNFNVREGIELRPYQEEAFSRFQYYFEDYNDRKHPAHLLFHMATGSGKTLLMAANILYLYKQGYRNFIFFVNSTNIIEKTKANFLDKDSSKYLFAQKVMFDDSEVKITEVDNFESANDNNINIHFTTIQGLHSRLNNPQENAVTFEDFERSKVVFLSDEAHHINTLTKNLNQMSKSEAEESTSWERTVQKAMNAHPQNVMLEYTATVELNHKAVSEKYADKILYQYSLKEFRQDGFSKEVNLLQSDMQLMDRALQAVILSQYRRKVAEKHKLNLKPVILFKSQRIDRSTDFQEQFVKMIKGLKVTDIDRIKKGSGDSVMSSVFAYFDSIKLTPSNLIAELKEDFSEEKLLSVNSQADGDDKETQLKVNSLEDYENEVRAVFTVNMLNEGWDVLNLFDIVRLYKTRDSRYGKAGGTTVSEAQLIGRGARYFPFRIDPAESLFKRKYDQNQDVDLRVLEELHYHSAADNKYIQELKTELVRTGITDSDDAKRPITVKVKDEIKKTAFWKEGLLFRNKLEKVDATKIKELHEIISSTLFTVQLETGNVIESDLLDDEVKSAVNGLSRTKIKLSTIEPHIARKALDKLNFYSFTTLSSHLPNLKSISEFITSSKYAGGLDIEVYGKKEDIKSFDNHQKFRIAFLVLDELRGRIEKSSSDFVGSREFEGYKISTQAKTKTMEIVVSDSPKSDQEYGVPMSATSNDSLRLDLSQEDWYIYDDNYGTSEEKHLVHFICHSIDALRKKYKDVYLLRNENLFKIYRFSDGRAVEPDFVLFLKEKGAKKNMSYQLFIEPKGGHLMKEDEWKQEFLKEIEGQFTISTLFESGRYKLIGLPFYNEALTKQEFEKEFKEKLKV